MQFFRCSVGKSKDLCSKSHLGSKTLMSKSLRSAWQQPQENIKDLGCLQKDVVSVCVWDWIPFSSRGFDKVSQIANLEFPVTYTDGCLCETGLAFTPHKYFLRSNVPGRSSRFSVWIFVASSKCLLILLLRGGTKGNCSEPELALEIEEFV